MNLLKKNIVLIVIVLAFAAVLGLSILMLQRKIGERDALADKLDAAISDRQRLRDQKTQLGGSLSAENVQKVRENTENEKKAVPEAVARLRRGTLTFEPVDELPGQALISQAVIRMNKMLDKSEIKRPRNFFFGFEKYSGFPPKKADTPLIQKQLRIIEELVKIASEAKVQEITTLKRVVFEDAIAVLESTDEVAAGAPVPRPAIVVTHSPAAEPLISLGSAFEPVDAPGYLYTVLPFQIELVCNTDALRDFLNLIARSEYILIPRIMNFANSSPVATTGASDVVASAVAAAKPAPAPAGETTTPPPPAPVEGEPEVKPELIKPTPDTLPLVFGMETIKVGMRIDYIAIRPEQDKDKDKDKDKSKGKTPVKR